MQNILQWEKNSKTHSRLSWCLCKRSTSSR